MSGKRNRVQRMRAIFVAMFTTEQVLSILITLEIFHFKHSKDDQEFSTN